MEANGTWLERRWLAGCLILGAALRLYRIGAQSLWVDEMISLQLATWSEGPSFWRGLLRDIHGPFNSIILKGWLALGQGEAWMRLLYAIPALLTIPVLYGLARELFDVKVARIAALALALSPFHVWYSQEVRGYTWALLWITAALYLFVRIWGGHTSRRNWVGLGALFVLCVLTNFSTVFLIASLTLLVALRRPPSRSFVIAWAGTIGLVGLAFLPWFLDWFTRLGGERMFVNAPTPTGVPLREASGFPLLAIPYSLWTFAFGYTLGPSLRELHLDRSLGSLAPHLPVLALGAVTMGYAAYHGLRRAFERGWATFVLVIVLVPLVLSAFLAIREIKTFHPRYLIVSFPVLAILVSAGWARGGRTMLIAGVATIVLALISLGNHYFSPRYGKEDMRSAAQLVLDNDAPGDAVVVIYSFRPFRHYYADTGGGRARLHHTHKRNLRTDEQMRSYLSNASADAGRVWLVLTRWWNVAPETRIRGVFEEVLREQGFWEFPGVKVLLYEGQTS